jgi:hypothetical protein
MNFLRRGQSMPMNLIVIAILCLLVLAIVAWIFYSQSGKFVVGVNSCSAKRGVCMTDRACYPNETILLTPDCKYSPASDEKKDGQCCIPLLG